MRRLVVILAVSIAMLAPASAAALDRTVSVKATVEREVPNDTAEIGFFVSKERHGRGAALRIVAIRLQAVIAAARAFPGVGPGDVSTGDITVRRVERGKNPVYRASEGVTVILHRPETAGELIAAGVAAGATGTRGPNFFVGDKEVAYDAALVEAMKRAKAKAEALAIAAGATLGPVVTIAESGDVVPAPMPAAKALEKCVGSKATPVRKGKASKKATTSAACAAPAPPVQAGNSSVTATVNAVFELALPSP
ncbi:MAG TPA: SIMPL domain-containing protein [Solirubrobacterales bacterium]|nr:SIMPL domain-containing protein [Solirubrobacterales bacterium]